MTPAGNINRCARALAVVKVRRVFVCVAWSGVRVRRLPVNVIRKIVCVRCDCVRMRWRGVCMAKASARFANRVTSGRRCVAAYWEPRSEIWHIKSRRPVSGSERRAD